MIFVSCSIENPSFDSQNKDALTSKPQSFGSNCKLSKSFLKDIVNKLGIYEDVVSDMHYREKQKLMKITTIVKASRQSVSYFSFSYIYSYLSYLVSTYLTRSCFISSHRILSNLILPQLVSYDLASL